DDEWALKRSHGIKVEFITGSAARDMEPALGSAVRRAASPPQWSNINDPKRLVDALRRELREQGVKVVVGAVSRLLPAEGTGAALELEDGEELRRAEIC